MKQRWTKLRNKVLDPAVFVELTFTVP